MNNLGVRRTPEQQINDKEQDHALWAWDHKVPGNKARTRATPSFFVLCSLMKPFTPLSGGWALGGQEEPDGCISRSTGISSSAKRRQSSLALYAPIICITCWCSSSPKRCSRVCCSQGSTRCPLLWWRVSWPYDSCMEISSIYRVWNHVLVQQWNWMKANEQLWHIFVRLGRYSPDSQANHINQYFWMTL